MRLLVVSDDERTTSPLTVFLRHNKYSVLRARTGLSAVEMLHLASDVVLLDLELSGDDGFRVCERIRQATDIPIIVITARTDYGSRVQCLNLGADDCIVKPYNFAELIARIRAVSRRGGLARAPQTADLCSADGVVTVGRVHIDLPNRCVTVDEQRVPLTRREFELLAILARQPGSVLRHEQILTEVWHTSWPETKRTLHVYIGSLRQKLRSPGLIESVHGVGYRLATA